MSVKILLVELGIDATNEDIAGQMRIMKNTRGDGQTDHVICAIRGFDDDYRELSAIPEVRAFCRRIVNLGFISYLDFATILLADVPEPVSRGWGAAEVWLCGEGRNGLTAEDLAELEQVVARANAKADALLRLIG